MSVCFRYLLSGTTVPGASIKACELKKINRVYLSKRRKICGITTSNQLSEMSIAAKYREIARNILSDRCQSHVSELATHYNLTCLPERGSLKLNALESLFHMPNSYARNAGK